ncbi:MAG: SAM-dependent methyltransferase [Alistipes sp.]|jgi:16S rRNA (cytidine1402-2'-O)-methyltransferase|nr:SAM-dependent methyltransferase [Alistipes sp.]
MKPGTLYLIPCPIGDSAPFEVLPAANFEVMRGLDYFIVENVRSARRFLSQAGVASGSVAAAKTASEVSVAAIPTEVRAMDDIEFVELNEHTRPEEIAAMLAPLLQGRDAGVISEAGVPAVADPGADLVAAAHRNNIIVRPLVGPSSILLALMASGANGQSFAFNGYLPAKNPDLARMIRHFERRAHSERQSQIFIETPYRNVRLFSELLSVCLPETRLTVAVDISVSGEFIRTFSVAEWRRISAPNLDKRPAIFIIS